MIEKVIRDCHAGKAPDRNDILEVTYEMSFLVFCPQRLINSRIIDATLTIGKEFP
jgi:hypothetical protein